MLSPQDRQRAADLLWQAEQNADPMGPLRDEFTDMDVVDSYEIQLINIRRKLDGGDSIRGHKVGLSSKVMQQMMGVDEPDYGHLLDSMWYEHGTPIPASLFCTPRIEVEIAFILGDTLPGEGCTEQDVLDRTEFIAPSLELIDSRIKDWDIKLVDTIADNASSAGLVLGPGRVSPKELDLANIDATLTKDGVAEPVATGTSGAVLGNPVTAVAWLANKVHQFGVTLEAGHVVLPGSCTKAFDVAAGETFHADFDGVGRVTVEFS